MAAVDVQLISTATLGGYVYGLQPGVELIGAAGAPTPPTVLYFDMRAWDTTQDVYWTSSGSPDLSPAVTVPPAVGALSNIQIIGIHS